MNLRLIWKDSPRIDRIGTIIVLVYFFSFFWKRLRPALIDSPPRFSVLFGTIIIVILASAWAWFHRDSWRDYSPLKKFFETAFIFMMLELTWDLWTGY
jgi:hypothetical protein